MSKTDSPIRPTDDEARDLARRLMAEARFCALGTLQDGAPMVARVAFGRAPNGTPLSLVSDLAQHTRALRADPAASLLVGEPGDKGDPLTHPRLTIQAQARFIDHGTPEYEEMAAHWLRDHPKAKLYIGFGDFHFALFSVTGAFLNGGFGKAFILTPVDLGLSEPS
ncbi:HugZ family pyridoxamine 5'-phosphate oxidase [Marinibacterium profundimaris]|uniref:Pyridoxamine 5-phosphate oxidase n=1 Tax=Marinibacterium profundimaris TaxID=1679460 RepID=A0A225NHN1_9RHOB|nr:pyridoxamine 5'-phosphate oxidase family protein [Marinibacterium profundimaris]OWU73253.1 pyridoxamine 5-phosphate oxidase [Marinibacterium profundimaris]